MLDIDFSELQFDNIPAWPKPIKIAAVAFTCLLILIAFYGFDYRNQSKQISDLKQQETQLRQSFEAEQAQAAALPLYKTQLGEIRNIFKKLLQYLPSKTEVPALLENISKTGLAIGLEFKLFDPLDEVDLGFYKELPIRISVEGNYHQLGQFISGISKLERIVTVNDIDIGHLQITTAAPKDKKRAKKAEDLIMSFTAKTYRYSGGGL